MGVVSTKQGNANERRASKMEVGQRVRWTGAGEPVGGVIHDKGYCALTVKWDDGKFSCLHPRDITDVVME